MLAFRQHGGLQRIVAALSGTPGGFRAASQARADCPSCHGVGKVFSCPRWPSCGCPEGTIARGCPGHSSRCECPGDATAQMC